MAHTLSELEMIVGQYSPDAANDIFEAVGDDDTDRGYRDVLAVIVEQILKR